MTPEMKLREAVRAGAAPVPEDFLWNTEQMIDRLPGKERPVMKRKLSFALVLALLLCLLAVGAVAAVLLSSQELVEREVLPMALENDRSAAPLLFTNEELQRIAALAQEHGVTLGENTLLSLENGLELPEREVVRELAYESFGPEPMFWTLEEQYWFHQVMVEMKVLKTNDCLLPGEGDLTEAEATARAIAELKQRADSNVSFLDHPEEYAAARSYQLAYDADGNATERLWLIGFLHQKTGRFYQVMLTQAGEYVGSRMTEQTAHNDTFSNAELARIVALAEENNIRLSDSILRALEKGEGYWEEEVIISLAKSQFGPYPAQWTIEEQYWFGEMCAAIGYQDSSSYHLPGENEMSYGEAYAKAREHVAAQGYDVSLLDDRTKYALSRSCIADKNKNGDILCVTWSFWFEPLEVDLPSFEMQMNADGSLAMFSHRAGLSEKLTTGTLKSHEVQDYFSDMYGNQNKWTPEIFVEYVTVLRQTDLTNASRGLRAYAATQFCLPPEGALTAEEAIALAKEAMPLENPIVRGAYCFKVDGRVCWKVSMRPEEEFMTHMAEMDAMTGEILLTYEADRGHVAQYFVPLSVWEATPEPEPDGLG